MKNNNIFNFKAPIDKHLILYGYRGSKSHGTYIAPDEPQATDDIDLMGVFIDDIGNYFGISRGRNSGTVEIKNGPYDIVLYEVRKMFSLLLKANPNVLSLLWLKEHLFVSKTVLGQIIIENRDIFSSKIAYHSFTGYAHSQLKKMTHLERNGYMGAKRKGLVEKFGYDTKNASHLIRLLNMGIEFLLTGELTVWRNERDILIDIKQGKWSLNEIKDESTRLFERAKLALLKSSLPEKPDYRKADGLLIGILSDVYLKEKI